MEKQKEGKKVWMYSFIFLIFGLVLGLIIFNSGITGNAIFSLGGTKTSTTNNTNLTYACETLIASVPSTYCVGYGGICFNKYTGVYQGCGNSNQYCTYNNTNGPQNIFCYFSNQTTTNCYDTDGGINFYTKGIVYGSYGNLTYNVSDYCQNSTSGSDLIEYGCTTNGFYTSIMSSCQYGCLNGACILPTNNTGTLCMDSDSGIDSFVRGTVAAGDGYQTNGTWKWNLTNSTDVCLSNKLLKEYYCGENPTIAANTIINCSYSCYSGACKKLGPRPPINYTVQTTA